LLLCADKLKGREVNSIQCPHRNGKRLQGAREHRSNHFNHRNSTDQITHRVAMRILELVRVDWDIKMARNLMIEFVGGEPAAQLRDQFAP
jgi:hypothetical protein